MTRADAISERFVAPSDGLSRRGQDKADAECADGQSFPRLMSKMAAARGERPAGRATDAKGAEQSRLGAEEWLSLMAADAEPPAGGEAAASCLDKTEGPATDGSDLPSAPPPDTDSASAAPGKDAPPATDAHASAALIALSLAKALSAEPQNDAEQQPAADAAKLPGMPVLEPEAARAARVAADLRVKVAVIHQETHFAPTVAPALQQELADRLSSAASPKEARQPAKHSDGAAIPRTAQSAPDLKVLSAAAVAETPDVSDGGMGRSRGALFAVDLPSGNAVPDGNQETQGGAGRLPGVDASAGPGAVAAGTQPSPGQQIASRVLTELRSGADGVSAPPAGSTAPKPPSGSAMKVLHIRLQPADLGTVTVRMSLKDDALELHLEAARSETAQMIGKDKEALSHLLRSAGYRVEGLAVHVADMSGGGTSAGQPGSQGASPNPQFSSQTQPGWSQSNGGSPDAHGRSGRGSENGPPIRSNNETEDAAPLRTGGGLYI